MLEGLEVSEVMLSDIIDDVETMRLDSEYHLKVFEAIDNFKRLNKNRFCKFSDFGLTIDCSAFYPGIEQYYGTGDNPLIRVQNVKDGLIDYDSCELLPLLSEDYKTLKWVEKGDIVITKGGTIGLSGYVSKRAYASRDLIFIKSSKIKADYSKYLYLYFTTDFAFKQLIRSSSQCAQPHLTITLVKDFDILKASDVFINNVVKLYDESIAKNERSKSLYNDAESLLLDELGLKNWQPNNKTVNIKQLKESYLASGRLDAEYYQPKYDEIESVVTKYKNGSDKIKNLFNQNTEVCNFKEKVYNYIEIGDINTGNGTANYNLIATEDLPDNAKRVLHCGDILISKVRPYRGAVSIIDFDIENLIASGAFTVLHEKTTYKKEVLQILLRTQIYKDWLLKWNVGSSYPVIKDEDIMELPIPIIPQMVQSEIAEYVQKSIALRNEAKQLLENAKLQVENEISWGGGN